jgi:hypothetical protein
VTGAPDQARQPENLIQGLLREIDRVEESARTYDSLPGGVGALGAALMRNSITIARAAIAGGDVIAMLRAYADLQGYES